MYWHDYIDGLLYKALKISTMGIISQTPRIINRAITRRVIDLHSQGYDSDFCLKNRCLLCMQNEVIFHPNDVDIKVIDQVYDQLSQCFKYIHTIDTCNGEKGVMVIDQIFTNASV